MRKFFFLIHETLALYEKQGFFWGADTSCLWWDCFFSLYVKNLFIFATVSLLHNWLTDTNRQWYLQYIQHNLSSINCRREERQGARVLDWNVPFTSVILQVETSERLLKLFFKTVRFGSHSVNLSYSTKPGEQVKDGLGDRKCPSLEWKRTRSM